MKGEGPEVAAAGPSTYEADVVLRDGSTVRVRPVRKEDEARLFEFLRGLSREALALRFFGMPSVEGLREKARVMAGESENAAFSLVATLGREERIVGHALYRGTRGDRAEAAFLVADACQGQGLGSILLGQLAQVASGRGVHVFEATVLPQNHRMLAAFRDSGFSPRVHALEGEIHLEFPRGLTEEARERFEQREAAGAINAVRSFLHPRSVAVIGASRQRVTIGGEVLHNLLDFGFQGQVLPVNPRAAVVASALGRGPAGSRPTRSGRSSPATASPCWNSG